MNPDDKVIPVIEEDLVTGLREVARGAVRVTKNVETVHKTIEQPLMRDVVRVSRIPVNRVVDNIPAIREEGDVVVIPVVEEEIVVHKRLVLKEEIHITRRRTREVVKSKVSLNRETATVERLDAHGNVIARSKPK